MIHVKNWFRTYALFMLMAVLVLLFIEWLVHTKVIPAFIIPAPSSVIVMIITHWKALLFEHLRATMLEFLVGFTISLVFGISVAIAMFYSKIIEKVLYPAVLISQMIPIIALSPIFVLWFGYTIWSKVAVTFLISFFPIVVGTYDGLKSSESEYSELLRSMGATRRQTLLKLHIPMALPSFFSGLKLAIVFALVGATIGEWLGASEGLGYYSRRMSGNLNAEGVFAAITILTVLGILLFTLVSSIEKRVLHWKNEA
ncbi:ABC transporter permease [Lederbergia lenta]|nr:ABC transporter permease [Lederbergia lenta]MEC2324726.1 ABC transporter permease [Lederbergia lenta]